MSKPRPVAALLALACLALPSFAAAQPAIPSTSPSPSAAVPPMPGASTPEEINRLRGAPTARSGAATRGLGVPHDTQLPAATATTLPSGAAMPATTPPVATPGR